MNFTSQICTTKEQSERLLALGLKRDTADMHHYKWSEGYWDIQSCPPRGTESCYIPAWSLNRLIEMMPTYIDVIGDEWTLNILQGKLIAYTNDEKNDFLFAQGTTSLYDSIIVAIECLIQAGHFNEKYLSEI